MWGRKRRFLDPDLEEWHIACWGWLMRHLGGVDALRETALVLPTAEFFPRPEGEGRAVAEAIFSRVRELMGLEQWACELVERHDTNAEVGEFLRLQPEGKPIAGTFESDGQSVVITYAPDLVNRPYNLIGTFAHELAHYVLHTIPELPPAADVEPMAEELATELAVAYFGFGLMAANGAFEFEQYQDAGRMGWRGGSWDYFSEDGWCFALAVFLVLREERPELARQRLKPHLVKKLDAALARLAAAPELLAPLRELSSKRD
ncbi:MAG TPA: hypothetical protein VEA80_13500 [Vitreimonas sp.]|uniref:hypothetical protein n=1 Tax=Vitreimonas sp. TaxID=3069702 RepID=UPI002D2B2B29|nr:hypothetical protein [Vitreimonas sp.]HYD88485.1 hypothetical protein [Vitreimonas sp.]